jgi:hypothetical protein
VDVDFGDASKKLNFSQFEKKGPQTKEDIRKKFESMFKK